MTGPPLQRDKQRSTSGTRGGVIDTGLEDRVGRRPRPKSPPAAGRPRSPPASRPLLDELFGSSRKGGDSPFDETSDGAAAAGPPKTIFAAKRVSELQHGTPSSLDESSFLLAPPNRRRARHQIGRFSTTPPRVPSTEDSTSRSSVSSSPSTPSSDAPRNRRRHPSRRNSGREHRSRSSSARPPRRRPRSRSRSRSRVATSSSRRSVTTASDAHSHLSAATEDAVRGCVRGSFLVGRHVALCWTAAIDAVHEQSQDCRAASSGGRLPPDDSEYTHARRNWAASPPLPHDGTDHTGGMASAATRSAGDDSDDNVNEKGVDDDDDGVVDRTTGAALDPSSARVADLRPPPLSKAQQPLSPDGGDGARSESPHAVVAAASWCLEGGAAAAAKALSLDDRGKAPSPTRSDPSPSGDGGLREVRLALFREDLDRGTDRVVPEEQYLQALRELKVQSEAAQAARLEADRVRSEFDDAQRQWHDAAAESERRQAAAAASGEKLVRERLEAEEKLRGEERRRDALGSRLEALQDEANELRALLHAEKLKAAKLVVARQLATKTRLALQGGDDGGASSQHPMAGADTEASAAATPAQMVLQAEVVRLRAALAEAHAGRLSAEQSQAGLSEQLRSKEVAETALRSLIAALERQAEELRVQTDRALGDRQRDAQRLEGETQTLRTALEEMRNECRKLSEEAGRLSGQLSESRAAASALREDLATAKEQRDAAVRESEARGRAAAFESRQLQERVRELTERLQRSDAAVLAQAADHVAERRRFEEELAQARRAAAHQRRAAASSPDPACGGTTMQPPASAAGAGADLAGSSVPHLLTRLVHRSTVAQDVAELLQRSRALQLSSSSGGGGGGSLTVDPA